MRGRKVFHCHGGSIEFARRRSPLSTAIARFALAGGLALAFASNVGVSTARAAEWPDTTIRVIVPYTAGSAADIVPRIVFEEVKKELGQAVIIENKPGASGTIGARLAAEAQPDGYTFLAASSGFTIAPATFPNLPYDPEKDFTGVGSLGNLPNVLVISPQKHIKTVQALVAAAKRDPVTFGSTGVGGPIYLTMQRFRHAAGFQARIIPFKGAPQALTETIAGRIDVYYSPLLAALPFIRSGQLLPLTVSSNKRVSALPDVPTSLEAGYPDSNYNFWIGVFAPAKTAPAIVERMNAAIQKALANPDVAKKLETIGVQPFPMGVKDFNAFVRQELKTNAELAKEAGIAKH